MKKETWTEYIFADGTFYTIRGKLNKTMLRLEEAKHGAAVKVTTMKF